MITATLDLEDVRSYRGEVCRPYLVSVQQFELASYVDDPEKKKKTCCVVYGLYKPHTKRFYLGYGALITFSLCSLLSFEGK